MLVFHLVQPLRESLATLTPAPLASMVQTDGGEVILPLEFYNADTIKIQALERVDALVSDMVHIEVVAQNKVDTCTYAIELT